MEEVLDAVLDFLHRSKGMDLRGYRRSTLLRRLQIRINRLGLAPQNYPELLRRDEEESAALLEAIAINVSNFFRDPMVFENLAQRVLPELIERKRRRRRLELRIWSAGCASGEEAYSLAILLHRALGQELADWSVHVFATDRSAAALRLAEKGIYPESRLEEVRFGMLKRYFEPGPGGYRLRDELRRLVCFSEDDLTAGGRFAPSESLFGGFDLILCRNVLIYFNPELQDHVFSRLLRSLGDGGYLVLGSSESPNARVEKSLRVQDSKNRIYQKPPANDVFSWRAP